MCSIIVYYYLKGDYNASQREILKLMSIQECAQLLVITWKGDYNAPQGELFLITMQNTKEKWELQKDEYNYNERLIEVAEFISFRFFWQNVIANITRMLDELLWQLWSCEMNHPRQCEIASTMGQVNLSNHYSIKASDELKMARVRQNAMYGKLVVPENDCFCEEQGIQLMILVFS